MIIIHKKLNFLLLHCQSGHPVCVYHVKSGDFTTPLHKMKPTVNIISNPTPDPDEVFPTSKTVNNFSSMMRIVNTLVLLNMVRAGLPDMIVGVISGYIFTDGNIDVPFIRKVYGVIAARNVVEKSTAISSLSTTATALTINAIAMMSYEDYYNTVYRISGGAVLASIFGEHVLTLVNDCCVRQDIKRTLSKQPSITTKDLDELSKIITSLPEFDNKSFKSSNMNLEIFNKRSMFIADIAKCYDKDMRINITVFIHTLTRWLASSWYKQVEKKGSNWFNQQCKGPKKPFRAYCVTEWNLVDLLYKAQPHLSKYTVCVESTTYDAISISFLSALRSCQRSISGCGVISNDCDLRTIGSTSQQTAVAKFTNDIRDARYVGDFYIKNLIKTTPTDTVPIEAYLRNKYGNRSIDRLTD